MEESGFSESSSSASLFALPSNENNELANIAPNCETHLEHNIGCLVRFVRAFWQKPMTDWIISSRSDKQANIRRRLYPADANLSLCCCPASSSSSHWSMISERAFRWARYWQASQSVRQHTRRPAQSLTYDPLTCNRRLPGTSRCENDNFQANAMIIQAWLAHPTCWLNN